MLDPLRASYYRPASSSFAQETYAFAATVAHCVVMQHSGCPWQPFYALPSGACCETDGEGFRRLFHATNA